MQRATPAVAPPTPPRPGPQGRERGDSRVVALRALPDERHRGATPARRQWLPGKLRAARACHQAAVLGTSLRAQDPPFPTPPFSPNKPTTHTHVHDQHHHHHLHPSTPQIFKYDGTLVARERRDVLYEASWLPAPEGEYEDRPQTPRGAGAAAANGAGGAAAAPLPAQPVKAAGYVPPHMRGKPGAAAAAAATFSLARDANDKGGKIPTGAVAARPAAAGNLPPGAAPPASKSASKNAKRRAAKKKSEGGADGAAAGVAGMTL